MKKILSFVFMAMFAASFAFAADYTITPVSVSPYSKTSVGGLPVFITFQSSNVGTADSVVIDAPTGFIPDYIVGYVTSATSNENFYCEWYKGMTSGWGHVVGNNGTNAYTAAAAVTLDNVNFNFSFGAECHTDAKGFRGWAARYTQ